jgi:hypothetical protein
MVNTLPCEEIASTIGELFSCSTVGEYVIPIRLEAAQYQTSKILIQ